LPNRRYKVRLSRPRNRHVHLIVEQLELTLAHKEQMKDKELEKE
jgi:hypothetical protein